MLANKLMSALSGAEEKLYVDDVFSAYTYTGNGSTQTINNGIDLAGKGGMVWIKSRTNTDDNMVVDTARGVGQFSSLQTSAVNPTTAINVGTDFTSFNSNGFTLGTPNWTNSWNGASNTYISWTFRKSPKFFDVVTWTGNGANRTIPHALGQEVGMMLVKRTNSAADWQVYHRSLANTEYMVLNSTAAKATGATRWNSTTATTSNISLGADATVNASGGTYVAYIFAHDPSADGIIQCGIYTGNSSSAGPTVELGWEPQYVLVKSAAHAANWWLWDSSRGLTNNDGNVGTDPALLLNQASAEAVSGNNQIRPLSTGFQLRGSDSETNSSGYTYIYLAIRRPNKPPTTGTEVYNARIEWTITWNPTTGIIGFSPDVLLSLTQQSGGSNHSMISRLTGDRYLYTNSTAVEAALAAHQIPAYSGNSYTIPGVPSDGVPYQTKSSAFHKVHNFFKRATGFFDVVCDDGTATAHAIAHNMTVAPELVIRKSRDVSSQWECWHAGIANTEKLVLNSTDAKATDTTAWNSTGPTPASFTVGTGANVNMNQAKYVTYLFATKAGISKVGSYTGNGTTQTINCGFTTGARFILIKRTDSTGDWYVWDTARGVVAGNDPHLSLNTTDAEVTTNDSIDPDASGFIVNQVADTNINVSGATYIFLAVS